ncbi:YihY/virulence factor BrkB family protein [Nocardia cerradoensis]|uniref:YihY/virulence factor BrkB family protein n=1 Tax=Nocardia cerradoensis TaxID=85688 RepID=UPI0002EBB662|nr:YhjD/YihY/BrkB family envelope integrity protein [Nocardia cerradoensis]
MEQRAPDAPTELPSRAWRAVLRNSLREFKNDELADRAAALTYYGVLALFPALLVLVSLLGIAGGSATARVMDNLRRLAPGSTRDLLVQAVEQLQDRSGLGSVRAVARAVGFVEDWRGTRCPNPVLRWWDPVPTRSGPPCLSYPSEVGTVADVRLVRHAG